MSDEQAADLTRRLALRPREAAEALGVSERTLRAWMRDEGLPYLRVGGAVRIPVAELGKWMAQRVASRRSAAEIASAILRDL